MYSSLAGQGRLHEKRENGPYRQGHPLGTYGVDPSTKTAWAVVNYTNARFAVSNFEPVSNCK